MLSLLWNLFQEDSFVPNAEDFMYRNPRFIDTNAMNVASKTSLSVHIVQKPPAKNTMSNFMYSEHMLNLCHNSRRYTSTCKLCKWSLMFYKCMWRKWTTKNIYWSYYCLILTYTFFLYILLKIGVYQEL